MKSFFLFAMVVFILSSCNKTELIRDNISQPEISTYAQIDSVYNSFQKISFSELPEKYRQVTGLTDNYQLKYAKREFLIIKCNDLDKNLVAGFPVSSFLPEFNPICPPVFSSGRNTFFLLVNKNLLYKILDLNKALKNSGYNPNGFTVRESFRPPVLNEAVGGATGSQHLYGNAADLIVEDADNNGTVDINDKQILLNLLEKIIGNSGGIGRYPGTKTIHIDVRGFCARWDFQNL